MLLKERMGTNKNLMVHNQMLENAGFTDYKFQFDEERVNRSLNYILFHLKLIITK